MNPIDQYIKLETRRQFFGQGARGLGMAALATMLNKQVQGAGNQSAATSAITTGGNRGLPHLPHFAPKAKRVIYLFMSGAPSQLDMYDYKPKLNDLFDKSLPDSVRKGQRLTTMSSGQARFPLAPSKFKFKQHGKSGAWISELLPYTAKMADDLAIIKTVHTEAINHDPAITYIQTGRQIPGWPSLGAWLSYGLGSENDNLPTFIVMNAKWSAKRDAQALYNRLWGSGILPSKHAGVLLRNSGDSVLFLGNPKGVNDATRRRMLDDTLVVWGGEYGRTVYCQGKLTKTNYGRDHHPRCFTMWMAGTGIKGGVVHGETDDFSYNVVKDPVHINDINATILHCLGINHQKLSIKNQGPDIRLTGVLPSSPIKAILA
jgi:hypothetical protein